MLHDPPDPPPIQGGVDRLILFRHRHFRRLIHPIHPFYRKFLEKEPRGLDRKKPGECLSFGGSGGSLDLSAVSSGVSLIHPPWIISL